MKFEPTNFAEVLAAEYLEILKQRADTNQANDMFLQALDNIENEELYAMLDEIPSVEEEEIEYPQGTRKVLGSGMMSIVEEGDCYAVMSYLGSNRWEPSAWLPPEAVAALKELPELHSDDY